MIAADERSCPRKSPCRSVARRRPARGRAGGGHLDRRGTGAAVVVRGRHRGAGDRRRVRARRQRIVASADRPPAARQRRHAPRRRSSSAASAICGSTASRRTSIATRPSALYRTGDGRWIRLHTNLPHHRAGTLKLLGADYDRASVQRAHRRLGGVQAGGRRRHGRSRRHRDAVVRRMGRHPQGRAVARQPLFTIERIGDAPAQPLPAGRSSARRRQGAGPHPRDRRPGVRAHARGPRRRRAEHHRRASAGDGGAGDRHQPRQAHGADRSARSRRPRQARRPAARRRHLHPGLSAGRHRPIRLQRRGGRAHPARHRLRLALRLRPRRTVGGPARLQLARAERQRPQRGRGGSRRATGPIPSRAAAVPRRSTTPPAI